MNRSAHVLITMAAWILTAVPALAQQPDPQAGPLIVERIHNGWLFAPDVRATEVNGETTALAGGYIGRIHDNSLVVGGGAYVLTNPDDDVKLAYGGAVVEWLVRSDRRIGFGLRTLVGGGSATLPVSVGDVIGGDGHMRRAYQHLRGRWPQLPQLDPTDTVRVGDGFLVAEPQVNVLLNLSGGQRLVFGLGYRATAFANRLGDQINGVSGSISYQFGGGR
jgi:hypothetical protein